MPKKSSVKKTGRSPKKKSFFEKFFNFRNLAIIAIAFTATYSFYQLNNSESVLGTSDTVEDFQFVTETEMNQIIKNPGTNINTTTTPTVKPSGSKISPSSAPTTAPKYPTFHEIKVFNDRNSNGKMAITESCLFKDVTITVGKKTRTKNACGDIIIYTKGRKCVTIKLEPVKGYNFTGLTYADKTTSGGYVTKKSGVHLQEVCGYPYGSPSTAYYTSVDFGVKKK